MTAPGVGRSARVRLRPDAFIVPAADGARIYSNGGTVAFTGAHIYQWLSRLAPRLDGTRSAEELGRNLPADKRAMVERIVTVLADRGLVREGEAPGAAVAEVSYLDSFVASARESYEGYRRARIVAIGSGAVFDELVPVLLRSGAGAVVTVPPPADGGYRDLARWLEPGTDLVVHVAEDAALERADLVDRACAEHGVPLVPAYTYGADVWILAGTDWRTVRRRAQRWPRPTQRDVPLSMESAALAASIAGMAAFRRLSGVDGPDAPGTVTCLNTVTLRTTTHHCLPWPARPAPVDAQSFVDSVDRLVAAPPIDPVTLDTAGRRLVDRCLGILGTVSEGEFAQLPLNVAAVTVAGRSRPVVGAGPTVAQAHWRAVLGGLARYAASTVDSDRLVGGRVWARRLADGSGRRLDADTVFASPDVDTSGVAAAYTWSDAVSAGLLDCCARLAEDQPAVPHRLDPVALAPDAEADAYLRMLDILRVPVGVYDVTGPLGVPTLAFLAGDRTVAYVSAASPGGALPEGLRVILQHVQAVRHNQPAYAPRAVPPLRPPLGNGGMVTRPPGARTRREIVDALLAHGLDPVVVPLDHDPALHDLLPFIARVVLVDA